MMNKEKFYIIIILGLLVSNIVLLGMIFFNNSHRPPPPFQGPKDKIVKILDFDTDQVKAFEVLIQQHQTTISQKDEALNNARKNYYNDLKNEGNNSDSILTNIANIAKEIETIHYNHFKDIKKLCHPNQTENFNRLVDELSDLFSKKEHKK